ncbi:amidohydrolase family protein [Defluviimonas sp. D31]|uniref:amidohydrolase family protein n=1 Tax=Defluviimonas sp. D31 TaxID=3083253 RepID=UPI00296FA4D3|nr:amidohydrolase family protein [Defluviimonas sp. D31]MDW4549048.1 amidohydrolase family protein [Defluviimonas sp. D31]
MIKDFGRPLSIGLFFSACAFGASAQDAAETLYFGGDILTMTGDAPAYVEALAVLDGKILFAGSRDEAMAMTDGRTRLVDLGGKTLMPAFIDGHSHYINSLLVANQAKVYAPPSGPGKDVPSIIAEIQRFAAERNISKGELIMAYGYDDSVMPDGRLLNRDDLDEAFPDNPVRVDHVSMHGAVMNSLALEKYGISAATETPPAGVIVRKPGTQEPWGLIMETAFLPVMEKAEPMTAQQEIDWSRAGQMLYAEAGITTAHEGASHLPQFETIRRASEAGANIIDVVAYPFITDLDKVLGEFPVSKWGSYHDHFKVGGVKITLDGSPQGRTAFFTTPYLQGGPAGEQDWYGEPTFPQDLARKMVKKVHDLGVPLIVHTNGDAAIDAFLEAYKFAREGDDGHPWNVTTIHTQFLRKDQIPAFVEYGVRPSFYTLHTFYFADTHIANRGEAQGSYISPMRDAIDAGLKPTNHSDFVVAPLDQMMMLWSAVNRVSRAGRDVGPDQRVTAFEGLKTMTEWAAEQYDEEASKGTLEAGKLADLVILDANPLKVDPMAIRDIKVVETIKEGSTIFPMPEGGFPATKAPADAGATYAWSIEACDIADVNTAANKTWTLTGLAGTVIEAQTPPSMLFSKGQLSVFGGVNQISGSYALVNDAVVMGELISTKKAGPPELMDLEDRFIKALAGVNGFTVAGEKLTLLTDGKEVAEFQSSE